MSGSQLDISHHIPGQTKTRLITSALCLSVWVRVTAYLSRLKGPAAEGLPAVPPSQGWWCSLPPPCHHRLRIIGSLVRLVLSPAWIGRLEGSHVPWMTKHISVLPPWPSSCWSPPQHDACLSVTVVLILGPPGSVMMMTAVTRRRREDEVSALVKKGGKEGHGNIR